MTAKLSFLVVAMGLTLGSVAYVSNAPIAPHAVSPVAYTTP